MNESASKVTEAFTLRVSDDLEIRGLELRDANQLEALKQNYTGEWLCSGSVEAFIGEALRRFANNQGFWAGLWVNGELAGAIGLNNVSHWNRCAEVSYMLGTAFRGKGIVTRAVRALVDYAFDELKMHHIEITVDAENLKSRAVPERLGFTLDATLKQRLWHGNQWSDKCIYSVRAEDWKTTATG